MKNQKQNQTNEQIVPISDMYIATRVSKNGRKYTALYVCDDLGEEHFVSFIHKKGEK